MKLSRFGLLLFVAFPLSVLALTSSITKLVFTNDLITVAPGELSGQLTVQLQNSSGSSEDTSETMDVTFTSTSITGEFLNSSGSTVSKTMSTGTANKNFFYRDSTTGTPTLTVKVTGRTSGATFTTTQNIIIGSGGTVMGTSTSQTNQDISNQSGQSNQTFGTTDTKPKIQAILSVHGPINVYINKPAYYYVGMQNVSSVPDLIWSFGDGGASHGESAWHTFNLEGTYVVLVKAPSLGPSVLARQTVYVTRPSLALRSVTSGSDGAIRIGNLSNTDLDISDYSLWSGGKLFVLPEGTILLPDSEVPFANKITGLDMFGDNIELHAPDGNVVDRIILNNHPNNYSVLNKPNTSIPIIPPSIKTQNQNQNKVVIVQLSTTTPVIKNKDVIVVTRKVGLWSKIIALPKLMIASVLNVL